jgi:hypothetical protein
LTSTATQNETLPAFGAGAYQWAVERVDEGFMSFYAHVRRNSSRIMRLVIAFLPLMMLLVGSCKTAQTSEIASHLAREDYLRAALFPDRLLPGTDLAAYRPAAGYVSRARGYVEDAPDSLTQLTRQDIGFLFGTPTMQRRDADAEIWQYKTKSCVVDFYFYGDGKETAGKAAARAAGNDRRVSFVDFRTREQLFPGSLPPAGQPSASRQSHCLQTIVDRGGLFSFHA